MSDASPVHPSRPDDSGRSAAGGIGELDEVFLRILKCVRLLKEHRADAPECKVLAEVECDAEAGAAIVKQLLAVEQNGTCCRAKIHPNALIQETAQILGETFSKSVRVSVNCDPCVKEIEGNAMELQQVLLNLCFNARDAMPGGGSLTLSSRNVTLQEPVSCAGLTGSSGDYVQIQVADSGIGMTEELQGKIFQPYFTTKNCGDGCGVGLSTVVRILRGLGALMSLESEPGHGTTFSVYFPVELREAEAAPVIALSTANNKLVMLVDDEAEICEMCKAILECFDYRVLTAENGMEALNLAELHPGEISAAVVDMMMPIMDGPTTIRALRQAEPSLKIIATSGLSVEEQSRVLEDSKPDVYLKKPYSADQLVAALANLHL